MASAAQSGGEWRGAYSVAQCSLEQPSAAQDDAVQRKAAQGSVVKRRVARFGPEQCGAGWGGAKQWSRVSGALCGSAVRCGAVRCSAVQCGAV